VGATRKKRTNRPVMARQWMRFFLLAPVLASSYRLSPSSVRFLAPATKPYAPSSHIAASSAVQVAAISSVSAVPTQTRSALLVMDQFSNMRRADTPLDEEKRAMQVICGVVGMVIGSCLLDSALVGMAVGVYAAGGLVNAGGSTGLWARELGWQAAQFAERLSLPTLMSNALSKAAQFFSLVMKELKAFSNLEQVQSMRQSAVAFMEPYALKARTWADGCGLSGGVQRVWNASRIGEWLELCATNIEKRRKQQGFGV
jgi:hypothetical protein